MVLHPIPEEYQSIMEQFQRIGGNFRISRVLFIHKMPLSTIGKVQRYKLRNIRCKSEKKDKKASEEKLGNTYKKIVQILEKIGVNADITSDSILEWNLGYASYFDPIWLLAALRNKVKTDKQSF